MSVFSKRSLRTKAKKKNNSKQAKGSRNKKHSVKRGDGKSKTKNRTKTRTVSKSHTATPTKDKSEGRKGKAEKGRVNDFKEKEPESEGRKTEARGTTDSVSKSKGSSCIPSSQLEQTKKVEVKNIEPDVEHVKRMLVKMKREKPKAPQLPLDEKSKLLMDRVVKKPYPLKYTSKSKQELLMDEKSSFFKVSVPNPSSTSKKLPEEDNYDSYPKLADVQKLTNTESIYTATGVPFWAEYLEPTEQDMVGIDEPVSVGSLHLEAFNDKQLPLKTCQDKSVVTLNPFQLLSALKKRDEPHFHPHLVFSNTVRTMINAQNTSSEGGSAVKSKNEPKEEKTPVVRFNVPTTITMQPRSPQEFVYLRSDPIGTAREARLKSSKGKAPTVTTTTTTEG